MEKPKTKKPKTIQMRYPAPYSHSWSSPNTDKPEKSKKKKAKKNPSLLESNLFPGCCRRNNRKPILSSNPYAPHLKYGIFPQQPTKTRSISGTGPANMSARNSADQKATAPADDKADSKRLKKAQLSDSPLFVIRPIDKKNRRQLTLSETLHLDIKPRRNLPRSPLFKATPTKVNYTIEK